MKALIINGSPRLGGNTSIAVNEVEKTLNKNGIETEVIQIGNKDITGCKACEYCHLHG